MPRKDLVRNRQRIVDAARAVFVSHGSEANLEEIAMQAQVATSTLYRHFATREDLVEAVLSQLIEGTRQRAAEAQLIADPAGAFRTTLLEICDLDGPEVAAFAQLAGTSPRLESYARALVTEIVGPPTTRLNEAGRLRSGITVDDIVTFIRMVEGTPSTAAQRRTALEVMLDGLVTR